MAEEEKAIRWGILGCGKISSDFARAMQKVDKSVLVAVASSSKERAVMFAKEFGLEESRAFDSYVTLIQHPEVDVVYMARTNNFHLEDVKAGLENGKHVLCEKPLGLTRGEVEYMVNLARAKGLFFMEAAWTCFFPAIRYCTKVLAEGGIGKVTHVNGTFGYVRGQGTNRLVDLALGGGSLYDVGIYLLLVTTLAIGKNRKVEAVHSRAVLHPGGADVHLALLLGFDGDTNATLSCSVEAAMPNDFDIMGTAGRIHISGPFHCPTRISVTSNGRTRTSEFPLPTCEAWQDGGGNPLFHFPNSEGLVYEIEHVADCLRRGDTESSLHPLSHSLALAALMESIRHGIGVKYGADAK
mmetsp:Transcript_11000/g.30832  ORF Transcript_11000/g.30832 Transcript_11000/m.30832 type:complete len:354 (-) Transcript_11000:806-1867(-)